MENNWKELKECIYYTYTLEKMMKEATQEDIKIALAEAIRLISIKQGKLIENEKA